ncbi:siphovirus ReqiPepy6 Gp37-like family protein [Methanococcus maripaludis]|nr:siphovirus ReqiPepy6 Gp37-like family protein [Methanococcus maripaludis]
MELKILNSDLKLQGVLTPSSLVWSRKMYEPGDFQLEIPYSEKNFQLLDSDMLLVHGINIGIPDPGTLKAVEKASDNGTVKDTITLSGVTGLDMLNWRVAIPPSESAYDTISSSPVETVMKHYVDSHLVNPTNTDRALSNLIIGTDKVLGDSINYYMRYEKIGEELSNIAQSYGLRHDIYIDKALKKLVYDVFEGTDHSAEQSENNRVIFSRKLENILEQGYTKSSKNYANHAIVGGSGTGTSRIIQEVGTETGFNRREVFISDSSSSLEDLTQTGNEAIEKYKKTESIPAKVYNKKNAEYGVDWDLGDKVTVISEKYGKTLHLRVTEVTENYSSKGLELDVTFGDPIPTILDALKSKFQEYESLKNV